MQACKMDKHVYTSVFNYVLVSPALLFKALAEIISVSCISCFVYTFEAEALEFKQVNISISSIVI